MFVFGRGRCIPAELVVFELKWLYFKKVVVFGKVRGIRAKLLVFG